jgi:YD repeat-containing protein
LQLIGNNNQRVSSYLFEYYDLNLLPSRFSYAQDHWNYFNGKYNNDLLQLNKVPQSYVGYFQNFVGISNRAPDPQYARVGMLKMITYPTRGYTTIDYEGHANSSGIINGGCRVLRTKSYSHDNPSPEIKKYVYSYAQSVADSAYYKEYNQFIDCQLIGSNRLRCTYGTLNSNSVYKTIYAGNSNINYGKVEIFNGENAEFGKEIHFFDIQMDTPAIPIWGQQITPLVYSNTGWMNGTHNKTEIRKAGNSLLQTENISPKYNETRNLKTVQCLSINYRWCCAWIFDSEKIYYWDVVPYEIKSVWAYTQSREVIRHETNGNITTTTTYGYDNANHSMLSNEQTVNSDGRTSLTRYYYPHDYGNALNFSTLKNKYMIGKLIDTRTYTDGKIIAGRQVKYNDFGQPVNLYIAEPSYSVTDIAFSTSNPYTFTLKESYSYFPARTLSQITRTNNYPIAYLWDNSGAYVMAIVEGAESSQISSQNGKVPTYDSQTLYNSLKSLAPASSLINTFTYRQQTGITKKTNPAGVNTLYEYDSLGRLHWIKNHDGNLIQKFDYKFANQ